jgi:hypothetical protein
MTHPTRCHIPEWPWLRCTAILQISLLNARRRLPATYTPQLRLRHMLVYTRISGVGAQPPTRSSGAAMGVCSHFLLWPPYAIAGITRTHSGMEAKGTVGAWRLDSASTCGLHGELLECPHSAVIAKAWWADILGRSGAISFTSVVNTGVLSRWQCLQGCTCMNKLYTTIKYTLHFYGAKHWKQIW